MPAAGALRILVLGYIVRGPFGGLAWHHLQYFLGLARLGHDVHFLEDSGDWESCYDPDIGAYTTDPSYGLRFANEAFARLGLDERWAYYDAHTGRWLGPCAGGIDELCASADCFLNVSGVNPVRPWLEEVPARVLIDTDPAFFQIRLLTDPDARTSAMEHNVFLSFGENIGSPNCKVPDDGLPWQPTRQPIVLDRWPVTRARPGSPFTCVLRWGSDEWREYGGVRYGLKPVSFGPYLDLPARAKCKLELAAGGPSVPTTQLREMGWRLYDAEIPSRDPWSYQRYIQRSAAEFGIAKHGYVVSRSGWFSERSSSYLASARPVLVQDTGFTDWLEAGTGVVAFSSPEEAVAGTEDILARYRTHAAAARAVAEEYFDFRTVLTSVLDRAAAAKP
jgi:hypothetical protein